MSEAIYVGTDKGLFVLTRGADGAWSATQGQMPIWAVEAIEISPIAPEVVYAGTRGDGVWRSADAGRSWTKPSYGRVGPGKVRSVTADPHTAGRLWVGGEPIQAFVSDDETGTWRTIESVQQEPWVRDVSYPDPTVEPHVRDIVVDPFDEKTVYVALQVGYVLKSIDGGTTWRVLRDGLDCDVHMITIDPRDEQRVLVATGGQDAQAGLSDGRALFASNDAGATWTPLAMNFDQDYALALAVRPDNPDIMYSALAKGHPGHWQGRATGADSVHVRSLDGGATWDDLDLAAIEDVSRKLAIAFSFDPGDPDRVYAALSSGEIVVTHDTGDSWTTTGIALPGVKDLRCVRL